MTAAAIDTTHRCLAEKACRSADIIDDERYGKLTEEPGTLCPGCAEHIASCIEQLPKDWAELRAALGERASNVGQKIRSTPTPAIPINTRREALMAQIVEAADRAAAIVSDALHTDQPDARRHPAPVMVDDGGKPVSTLPRPGTPAAHATEAVEPDPSQVLHAAIAMVEPNVDLLVAAAEQPALVWKSPRRCDEHAEQIADAEAALAEVLRMPGLDQASLKQIKTFLRGRLKYGIDDKANEKLQQLNSCYHDAGMCEDCGGWCKDGQARELVELTGIEIAMQLVGLHNQARAELGKTRLRHKYAMPCPNCGGDVGRNDGTAVCDCDSCGRSWTEKEYKLLAGLIADERRHLELMKFWLAEAYWRLDALADAADIIRKNPDLDTDPAGGRTVLKIIDAVLAAGHEGHQRAPARATSTNRESAELRQVDEDNWSFRNPDPYRRPRRKRRRVLHPPKNPISASSLTLMTDIQDVESDVAAIKRLVCPRCHIVHTGDCG